MSAILSMGRWVNNEWPWSLCDHHYCDVIMIINIIFVVIIIIFTIIISQPDAGPDHAHPVPIGWLLNIRDRHEAGVSTKSSNGSVIMIVMHHQHDQNLPDYTLLIITNTPLYYIVYIFMALIIITIKINIRQMVISSVNIKITSSTRGEPFRCFCFDNFVIPKSLCCQTIC